MTMVSIYLRSRTWHCVSPSVRADPVSTGSLDQPITCGENIVDLILGRFASSPPDLLDDVLDFARHGVAEVALLAALLAAAQVRTAGKHAHDLSILGHTEAFGRSLVCF